MSDQQLLAQGSEQFTYKVNKPLGFPSRERTVKYYPTNNPNNQGNLEILRFLINSTGFWDPYSAYFYMKIESDHLQQLDNSGHSFISQLIIRSNGLEIERISSYDVLMNMLVDCMYDENWKGEYKYQGFGNNQWTETQTQPYVPYHSTGFGYDENMLFQTPSFNSGTVIGKPPTMGQASSTVFLNQLYYPNIPSNIYQLPVGGQYFNSNIIKAFIQRSYSLNNPVIDQYKIAQNFNFPSVAFQKYSYLDNYLAQTEPHPAQWYEANILNTCAIVKYFTNVNFEPIFGNDMLRLEHGFEIFQGRPIPKNVIQKQFLELRIPIGSGILGHLMPKKHYKYIPLSIFSNLEIEIHLNRHATFVVNPYEIQSNNIQQNTALANQLKQSKERTYKILEFNIITDIIVLEQGLEQQIVNQIEREGLILQTDGWQYGPVISCPQGQIPKDVQINIGFDSLKSILFCFLSEEYLQYSALRKQWRHSLNLKTLQLKIGNEYFPPLPINGESGKSNTFTVEGGGDFDSNGNSEFLINLFKAVGELWDPFRKTAINPYNYSISGRDFDFTSRDFYFDNNNNNMYFGYTWFKENTYVGKCVYGIDLESFSKSNTNIVSGVRTQNARPFNIMMQQGVIAQQTLRYSKNYSMHSFFLYDKLVQYKNGMFTLWGYA